MKKLLSSAKAIILDVDQTLIDVNSIGDIYSQSLAKFGVNVPGEELDKSLHTAWARIRDRYINAENDYKTDPEWEKESWYQFSKMLCSYHETPEDFDAFFDDIYNVFSLGWTRTITPGAVEFLEEVNSSGKLLGALTNNDERTINVFDELDLTKYFDFVGIACVLGWKKPSPKAFKLTAEKLGAAPEDCVFIGNSIELDYEGPKAAGMQAILYNYEKTDLPDTVEHSFTEFSELKGLLKN